MNLVPVDDEWRSRTTPSCGVPLRTGNLRDPNGPQVTFAFEGFIDELAAAAKADPVQFRLDMLEKIVPLPIVPGPLVQLPAPTIPLPSVPGAPPSELRWPSFAGR